MRSHTLHHLAVLVGLVAVPMRAAHATDGHFLHGIGAINSAMGGAGVAAPQDVLTAFYLNPAGLMAFRGTRADLSFEMFKPDRSLASSAGPMLPAGKVTTSPAGTSTAAQSRSKRTGSLLREYTWGQGRGEKVADSGAWGAAILHRRACGHVPAL